MSSCFISGRKNCHLKGLNSYVISDRVNESVGMVRVFHNTGDALPRLAQNGKFVLAPHNHRQDITLELISGSAWNIDFSWDSRYHGGQFYEWAFKSAIVDGGLATQFHNTGDLRIVDVRPIDHRPLFLKWDHVHTVVASPGSSWQVTEGQTAPPKAISLCYSMHKQFHLSQDDLYEPMTLAELAEIRL